MQKNIHPEVKEISFKCSCGHEFVTRTTMRDTEQNLEICSKCHPFYTGTQKIIDTAGRVQRFKDRYGDL